MAGGGGVHVLPTRYDQYIPIFSIGTFPFIEETEKSLFFHSILSLSLSLSLSECEMDLDIVYKISVYFMCLCVLVRL